MENEEKKMGAPKKLVISDPILGECHITVDGDQYTLFRGKTVLGYYGSLNGCLKKMVKDKLIEKADGGPMTVGYYIRAYEKLMEEFKAKFLDDEGR